MMGQKGSSLRNAAGMAASVKKGSSVGMACLQMPFRRNSLFLNDKPIAIKMAFLTELDSLVIGHWSLVGNCHRPATLIDR